LVEQLKGEDVQDSFELGCEEVAALEKAAEGPLAKRILRAMINLNTDPHHPPERCMVDTDENETNE
jgi:hypothetical protein